MLQHEWERLRTDALALAHANSWQVVNQPFADLNDLLYAIGSHSDDPAAEGRLNTVVRLARYEPLAGRVALQRLLAGLVAIAKRRSQHARCRSAFGSLSEIIDELVAAAWIEIRGFRPHRRPACLSAALLRDTEHRVFRHRSQDRLNQLTLPLNLTEGGLAETVLIRDHRIDLEFRQPLTPIIELAAVVRESRLDASDRDLLRHLLVGDIPGAAARFGVTDRTVRYRRQRLTARLRASA